MSHIDEKYIAESMTEYKPKMPVWVKRSLATAAVFVLVFAAAIGVMNGGMTKNDTSEPLGPEANEPTVNPSDKPDVGTPDIDTPDIWYEGEALVDLDVTVGIVGNLAIGETVSTGDGKITVEEYLDNVLSNSATNVDPSEIGVLAFYGTERGYYVEAGAPGANINREGLEKFEKSDLSVEIIARPDGRVDIDFGSLIESGKTPTIIYLHVGNRSYRVELSTAK